VRLTDVFDLVIGSSAPSDLARSAVQLLSPAVMADPYMMRAGEPNDDPIRSGSAADALIQG